MCYVLFGLAFSPKCLSQNFNVLTWVHQAVKSAEETNTQLSLHRWKLNPFLFSLDRSRKPLLWYWYILWVIPTNQKYLAFFFNYFILFFVNVSVLVQETPKHLADELFLESLWGQLLTTCGETYPVGQMCGWGRRLVWTCGRGPRVRGALYHSAL